MPVLLKSHRDELRNADLFHRHAIESARHFHRALVVSNDNELRARRHLRDLVRKSADVGLIQRRVYFIKQTERRWAVVEDAKNQRQSGHRFLATRE
jgi:hypothetical protein